MRYTYGSLRRLDQDAPIHPVTLAHSQTLTTHHTRVDQSTALCQVGGQI